MNAAAEQNKNNELRSLKIAFRFPSEIAVVSCNDFCNRVGASGAGRYTQRTAWCIPAGHRTDAGPGNASPAHPIHGQYCSYGYPIVDFQFQSDSAAQLDDVDRSGFVTAVVSGSRRRVRPYSSPMSSFQTAGFARIYSANSDAHSFDSRSITRTPRERSQSVAP